MVKVVTTETLAKSEIMGERPWKASVKGIPKSIWSPLTSKRKSESNEYQNKKGATSKKKFLRFNCPLLFIYLGFSVKGYITTGTVL